MDLQYAVIGDRFFGLGTQGRFSQGGIGQPAGLLRRFFFRVETGRAAPADCAGEKMGLANDASIRIKQMMG